MPCRRGGRATPAADCLPASDAIVNSHGQTIEEARTNLRSLASMIFDLERAQAKELLEGKDVVREDFTVAV